MNGPDANTTPSTAAKSASLLSISKAYDGVLAVDDVSLDIRAGEFVSLLGPSGSGKTTVLMLLAGFETPTAGRILVDGRDITHVPANRRDIGLVFQKYALFPHMSVAQNIAFPLRMRRMSRARIEEEVRLILDMVQLSGYEDRMPAQLSGGQQQRVALARAVVFRPQIILMDEPLGALDRKLRQHLQIEIKQLQERLGATVVFVTHDQEEALTMSDRVAILNHGRVCQFDTPKALYRMPADTFVAGFIGEMNFLKASWLEACGGCHKVRLADGTYGALERAGEAFSPGEPVKLAIRPEAIRLEAASSSGALHGRVSQAIFSGADLTVFVTLSDGQAIRALVRTGTGRDWQVGHEVSVGWSAEDALLFPEERS